jgi:hypothetical protein
MKKTLTILTLILSASTSQARPYNCFFDNDSQNKFLSTQFNKKTGILTETFSTDSKRKIVRSGPAKLIPIANGYRLIPARKDSLVRSLNVAFGSEGGFDVTDSEVGIEIHYKNEGQIGAHSFASSQGLNRGGCDSGR